MRATLKGERMSRPPEYVVEVIVCRYEDDTHWHGDGRVLATVATEAEAVRLADLLEKLLKHTPLAGT